MKKPLIMWLMLAGVVSTPAYGFKNVTVVDRPEEQRVWQAELLAAQRAVSENQVAVIQGQQETNRLLKDLAESVRRSNNFLEKILQQNQDMVREFKRKEKPLK